MAITHRIRVNIILTVAQYDRIKAKAEQTGESMASLIRAAIEKHYPKEKAS